MLKFRRIPPFPAAFMPAGDGAARAALVARVAFAAAALTLTLSGCSTYYNTYFNAEKAFDKAVSLKVERLRENPDDSTAVSPTERTQLIRAITKGSKVLELWPDDEKYAPKAVFLIAESQFRLEDYGAAAQKYDEYLRAFPTGADAPLARVRLADAHYRDGKRLAADEALAAARAHELRGDARRELLLLEARRRVDDAAAAGRPPAEGLALYEQLLAEGAFPSPEGRNEVRWRAAQLAYEIGAWEKARALALAAGEGTVPAATRFRNHRLAILSLLELGRHAAARDEARALFEQREYRPYRADLKVLEARAVEGLGDWPAAAALYRDAVRFAPRSVAAGEAWYRLGARVLDVDNREAEAKPLFDSAAAASPTFGHGLQAAEISAALARLAELRRPDTSAAARAADSAQPHYRRFMIAELFHFRLPRPDSARKYLREIVADTVEDSAYTRRALYALAWIERESFAADGGAARGDSLYRAVMARYPGTEWAKQAEANLGLPRTVETLDDKARALFLAAERLRLDVGAPPARTIPAYQAVNELHPAGVDAARARLVLAYLTEAAVKQTPPDEETLEEIKTAWRAARDTYPGTPFALAAEDRLNAILKFEEDARRGDAPTTDSGRTEDLPEEEEEAPVDGQPGELIDAGEDQDLY